MYIYREKCTFVLVHIRNKDFRNNCNFMRPIPRHCMSLGGQVPKTGPQLHHGDPDRKSVV